MRKLPWLFVIVAVLAAPLAVAQEMEEPAAPAAPVAPKPVRKVDPAAQKLIDAAAKMSYSAVAAGLEEMSCKVSISHPQLPMVLNFVTSFTAPDKTVVKITDLPPEMAAYGAQFESQFGKMVENFFTSGLKGAFDDVEKYNLEMKEGTTNVVVQTKFAPDAETERSEITFGEDGLPTKIINTTPEGEMPITPTFEKKDGKYVMTKATFVSPMTGEMALTTTYQKVGKFWITSKIEMGGAMGALKMAATDITVKPAGDATPATPVEPGK